MTPASTPHTTIAVWGVRGGHGATVVAGAIASFLGAPVRSDDTEALAWIWSCEPMPSVEVWDAGTPHQWPDPSHLNLVVVRGPCSLALKALSPKSHVVDGVVVVREPWRPIRRADAAAALSAPIVAEVAHSARIARLADAGLLGRRFQQLDEFGELRAWADTALSNVPTPPPS